MHICSNRCLLLVNHVKDDIQLNLCEAMSYQYTIMMNAHFFHISSDSSHYVNRYIILQVLPSTVYEGRVHIYSKSQLYCKSGTASSVDTDRSILLYCSSDNISTAHLPRKYNNILFIFSGILYFDKSSDNGTRI